MFDALAAVLAPVFNRRGSSLSVPILDGAFKPNNLLEEAPVFAEHPELEDIAVGPDGELYAACGQAVTKVSPDGEFTPVASFDQPVTAITVLSDGALAVALGTRVIIDPGAAKSQTVSSVDGLALNAVTAIQESADGTVLICDGSATCAYPEWSRDLLERNSSGRLLGYERSLDKATTLAAGLGYAFGAHVDAQGRILVSESWRHQVSIVNGRRSTPAIPSLPGYPARIAPAVGGGFWLTLFACRTQLVEFVLRENDYRRDMLRTVDPKYWVAPALSSGTDFREPLQAGGVKQMGILKPWAPPRSYGLVIRFGADLTLLFSLHSRVGGRHHGVVAVAQRGDELFVLSKGAGRILRLSVPRVEAIAAQEADQ